MKLYGPSQAQAQAFADRAHAYLLAHDAAYAASVAAGNTTCWALPAQDVDANGQPVGNWWIQVTDRCAGAFTPQELGA